MSVALWEPDIDESFLVVIPHIALIGPIKRPKNVEGKWKFAIHVIGLENPLYIEDQQLEVLEAVYNDLLRAIEDYYG